MAKPKYCGLCERMVVPEKKWKWGSFFLSCLVFLVGGLVYVLWYFILQKKQCPICGNKKLKKHKPEVQLH